MPKKVAIITFGCKVNQYESACIIDDFSQQGFSQTSFDDRADVYIINTCTVTNRTDAKSRTAIRKALSHKKEKPDIKVIVTGCYSQLKAAEIAEMGNIDLIVDNNKKNRITDFCFSNHKNNFEDILQQNHFSEHSTEILPDNSRAFLKVQDGCDYYCTYCAIPYARGHSRSRDLSKVISQVHKLVAHGYQEIVLGGINLGLYGLDLPQKINIVILLQEMEKVQGLKIIRLSSIEPLLFDDKLLNFIKTSTKIAPHFHIPLQSGADRILKLMKRNYNTSQFAEKVNLLSEIKSNAAFGFDLIVGFPGESDELFNETYQFLSGLDFTYLHLFPYSKRNGTPAAKMRNQINGKIVKQRIKLLKELANKKKVEFMQTLISNQKILNGVIENKQKFGLSTSLSDRFIRIYCDDKSLQKGEIYSFQPIKKYRDGILTHKIN